MDAFPVEVIGNILSHVADARFVAIASATCRKWRDAAKHHLYRLSFDVSKWGRKIGSDSEEEEEEEEEEESDEGRTLDECEAIITEAVMHTTCLQELSICHTNKKRLNVTFSTAPVIAWLLHTKRTLTHLTLSAHIKSKMNILEKLATGGEGVLKCLVWHSASIPRLDPSIHSLPSLVSLTLNNVVNTLSMRDLYLLLTIFHKLEFLTLMHVRCIPEVPSAVELNIPSLLRALKLEYVSFGGWRSVDLLLHACHLESLSLCNLRLQKLDLGEMENLQHLEISKCKFAQLKVGSFPSLLHAKLIGVAHETRVLPLFLEIISKVGSKLSKLHLLIEDADTNDVIDVDTLASSFPELRCLCLDYEHAFSGSPKEIHKLEQVSVLELHTSMNKTNDKLFAQWIVGFLKCCPKVKQLTIVLGNPTPRKTATKQQFVSRLASLLIGVMRPYPHVDVKFEM